MILFHEDWFKEENKSVIIHWNTKNKSFLNLVALLEHMDIENRYFFLALHDRDLEYVDPYDPELTDEIKLKILRECLINPWYFFREVLKILPPGGLTPIHFRANRFNISLIWCFFTHVTTLGLAPRQVGKTFTLIGLIFYLLSLGAKNSAITLLTKNDQLRTKTLADVKNLFEVMPKYLLFKTNKDIANTESITVKSLKNTFTAFVGQASAVSADKLGRGITTPIVWDDEGPFTVNIDITLPALLTATNAAIDSAKNLGAHYGIILTTTAGFLHSKEGKYFKEKVYDTCLPWTEKLFDSKNEKDLHETIRKNNTARLDGKQAPLRVLLEYNHRQLGYTDEWLKEKIEQANAEGENVKADYFNIWGNSNEESPIPADIYDIMCMNKKSDYYSKIYPEGYIIRYYIPKEDVENGIINYKGVIVIDPSEANGKDDIGFTITNALDGSLIGAGNFNETNLLVFSDWLFKYLMSHPTLVLIVERRSTGSVILDYLIHMFMINNIDPFKRIFNWIVDEYIDNTKYKEYLETRLAYRNENFYNKIKVHFGFATSGSGKASRSMLYGRIFNSAIKYLPDKIYDNILINQLGTLQYRNGRIDHPEGGHDDLVICWLISYWFLTMAKNKKIYGLPPEDVLQNLSNKIKDNLNNTINEEHDRLQNSLKEELKELKSRIKSEKNTMLVNNLIGRFNFIASKIDDKEFLKINIDEINNFGNEKEMKTIEPIKLTF